MSSLISKELAARAGLTPDEVSKVLRVSPDKIRRWIRDGVLGAIDTAEPGAARPRFTVLVQHLEAFVRARSAAPPPKPPRRKRAPAGQTDYFPDQ